jgi:hypothetical protein
LELLNKSRLPQTVELERLELKDYMSTLTRHPHGRSQHLTFSRRELFQKVAAVALPFAVLPKPSVVPPLKNRPVPDFWFGDRVSFCWVDEETKELNSETGEIVGAVWDSREDSWEYAVNWLSSTTYSADSYPIYDGGFLTAGEICKL